MSKSNSTAGDFHYSLLDSQENMASRDLYKKGEENGALVQEKGMTPINILPEDCSVLTDNQECMTWTTDDVTQTSNGIVTRATVLHIPGESGELAGSESDYSDESDSARTQMLTDNVEFYSQVLGLQYYPDPLLPINLGRITMTS